MYGKTIEIFWADGTGDGIVTGEISGWNGFAIKIPRTELANIGEFGELNDPGVYFLFCEDEQTNEAAVYIGESENVPERLKQHVQDYKKGKEKFYWHTAIAFTGKELHKTNIRFIENELVQTVRSLGHTVLTINSFQHTVMKRAQKATALEFIDHLKILMQALGYSILKAVGQKQSTAAYLSCKVGKGHATGYVSNGGFVVLKNSTVSDVVTGSLSKGYAALREKLVADGTIANDVFQRDYEFSSPSAAAAIVKGRSASGNEEWKNKDGVKLKEL